MNWLQSVLYGFLSGLSEFMPVSPQANQGLMLYLFGMDSRVPLWDLCVHIGVLLGLFISIRALLSRIHRDKMVRRRSRQSRTRTGSAKAVYDIRLVRTSAIPMVIVLLLYLLCCRVESNLPLLALFLILNGFLVLLPGFLRLGNKDARYFSGLDGIGLGLCASLSAIPGISRIGVCSSYCLARGADRESTYNWALLLSIPALLVFLGIDIFRIAAGGMETLSVLQILQAVSAGFAGLLGGLSSVSLMRYLMSGSGAHVLGYLSLGTGLFTFIIYLIT